MFGMAAALALLSGADGARLCEGVLYDQFDFWLGDWTIEQRVHQSDGSIEIYPASTSVTRSPDGCAVTEHWRGKTRLFWYRMEQPEELWGYSVRRIDPESGEWLISWIDGKSLRFGAPFAGKFDDRKGVFFQNGKDRRGRIRFNRRENGSVQWDLAILHHGSNE